MHQCIRIHPDPSNSTTKPSTSRATQILTLLSHFSTARLSVLLFALFWLHLQKLTMKLIVPFSILFLNFCFNFFTVAPAYHPNVDPSSFCYDDPTCGPSTWGGVCRTGKQQSPIDIDFDNNVQFTPTKFFMNEHYLIENVHKFFAQNNGHSAQFELNPNTSALTSNLIISGGELSAHYKFAQLHFHWAEVDSEGSEHTISGDRYPMEAHLVHYKSKYNSFAEAATSTDDRDAVAVMAVFFKIGSHNEYLDPFIGTVETLKLPGAVEEFDFPLRILDIYPSTLEYVRYLGSLTTPTCDEKVVWTVFLHPLHISKGQIEQFRRLSNGRGNSNANFRPTQPLHGRNLEFYVSTADEQI